MMEAVPLISDPTSPPPSQPPPPPPPSPSSAYSSPHNDKQAQQQNKREQQQPLLSQSSSDPMLEGDYGCDYDCDSNVNHQTSGFDNDPTRNKNKNRTARQLGGAAVVGGVAGLVLVGPLVGVVAAAGAVTIAATNNGAAGKVTRATGEAAATAGDGIRKINQKLHVTERTAKGISWVAQKVRRNKLRKSTGSTSHHEQSLQI